MFLAGRTPAYSACTCSLPELIRRLEAAGYHEHTGPRIARSGELVAYVKPLERERQVHVQIVQRPGVEGLDVYAHTEPWGWGWRHLWAALTDRVSYQHGARILRNDLRLGEQAT